jgi:hypothetical protein
MSVLNFLMGMGGVGQPTPLTSTKNKTVETKSTLTSSKTNPYIPQATGQNIVQGALDASANYEASAKAKGQAAEVLLADTKANNVQGKQSIKTGTNNAIELARIKFETAKAAAAANAGGLREYSETYGSEEYKETKRKIFEQHQRDQNEMLEAQAQMDSGNVLGWLKGALSAGYIQEELEMSAQMMQFNQQQEINATQALQSSLMANEAIAGNANAEQTARATMMVEQANALVNQSKARNELNREEFMAMNSALGFDQHISAAAYDRLNAMSKTNELSNTMVRAEMERVQLDTAKLQAKASKEAYDRNEASRTTIELSFKAYQEARGIPEDKIVTFNTAVTLQDETKLDNPILGEYLLSRDYTMTKDQTAVSEAVSKAVSRVPTTEADRTTVKVAQELLATKIQREKDAFFAANPMQSVKTASGQEAVAAIEAKYALTATGRDGKPVLNSKVLTELDKEYADKIRLAQDDLNKASGLTPLDNADTMVNALAIRERMLAAGADPEIVELVQSGKADAIKLDIAPKPNQSVQDVLGSNAAVFVGTMADADLMDNAKAFSSIKVAAKYQATAYKQLRLHKTTQDTFPTWKQSLVKPTKLSDKSSLNLESAADLEVYYRQALVTERSKRVMSQSIFKPGYLSGNSIR